MVMSPFNNPLRRNFRLESAAEWRKTNPSIDKCLRYFEAATGGDRLPRRSDFKPMEMGDILPQVALFEPEYNADGSLYDIRITLIGSKLEDFYGPVTGKLVSEHPHSEVRARVRRACEHCINERRPIIVRSETLSNEKDYLALTILYVPFSQDGDRVDRLFVYNQVESNFGV